MIGFEGVSVRYPRAVARAVDGLSFGAQRGRLTAIAGPNGSGKSTIVRALLRRVPLEGGRIAIDGTSVDQVDRREFARRVAVVTQREELVFALPVRDYVALGRYPHESPWRAETRDDDAAIDAAMAMAEVEEFAHRSTLELSGGEWQRVRIARALAQGGEAIVLDEPTTFLDIAHEMATFELLATLARRGHAVLMVSHQLNLVARFADEIVLLSRGRLAAAGSAADVMRADVLERVYEWPLVVTHDPAVGAPSLLPLRTTRTHRPPPRENP